MTFWPRAMPAMITPFDEDGNLDREAHGSNVDFLTAHEESGVLLAGSTGQGPYLEAGERADLTTITRSVRPNATIVCAVHAETDRAAIVGIGEAHDSGADAVLVVTPTTLVRGRSELVVGFYKRIADQSPLPVLLYSVPSVTAWELPVGDVIELAEHPNIAGIKDSGGDPERIKPMTETLSDSFVIYAGSSRALAASAESGAWGAITASANYAIEDVSLAARGDIEAQRRLTTLTSIIEPFGLAGTTTAAGLTGLTAGRMRRPLVSLDELDTTTIRKALMEATIIGGQ